MKLLNGAQALVDIAKLRDYCLNTEHPCGRHEARVLAGALGITADNAEFLREALPEAARDGEAAARESDGFGERYVLVFEIEGVAGTAALRSSWIVRAGEEFPRLTSCYVL